MADTNFDNTDINVGGVNAGAGLDNNDASGAAGSYGSGFSATGSDFSDAAGTADSDAKGSFGSRIGATSSRAMNQVKDKLGTGVTRSRDAIGGIDAWVTSDPWKAIGFIALGAMVAGFLLSRSNRFSTTQNVGDMGYH